MMRFHLKIKDKQGNRLNATINANSLEEAHENVIKKGYQVVLENTNDLLDTMVIKPEDQKLIAQMQADLKEKEIKNNNTQIKTDPTPILPEKKNRLKERTIRQKGRQKNTHATTLNSFYIYMSALPIFIIILVYTFGHLGFNPPFKLKSAIIFLLVITVICLICNVLSLVHAIKKLKKIILGLCSVLLIINIFLTYKFVVAFYYIIKMEQENLLFYKALYGVNSNESDLKNKFGDLYSVKIINGKVFLHYINSRDASKVPEQLIKDRKGDFV